MEDWSLGDRRDVGTVMGGPDRDEDLGIAFERPVKEL